MFEPRKWLREWAEQSVEDSEFAAVEGVEEDDVVEDAVEEVMDDVGDVFGSGHSLSEIRKDIQDREEFQDKLFAEMRSHQKNYDKFFQKIPEAEDKVGKMKYAAEAAREELKLNLKNQLFNKVFRDTEDLRQKALIQDFRQVVEGAPFNVSTEDFDESEIQKELQSTRSMLSDEGATDERTETEMELMMGENGLPSLKDTIERAERAAGQDEIDELGLELDTGELLDDVIGQEEGGDEDELFGSESEVEIDGD